MAPSTGFPNDNFTVTGAGWCESGPQIQIKWDAPAATLNNANANALGAFSVVVGVPNAADPGTHTVTATQTCNGVETTATATYTVFPEVALALTPGALLLVRQLKKRRQLRPVRSHKDSLRTNRSLLDLTGLKERV